MSALGPMLFAALGGGALALAARELLRSAPELAAEIEAGVETLISAGSEGSLPSELERRRLAALTSIAIGAVALLAFGIGPLAALAAAGPGLASWAVGYRRRRYVRSIEAELPGMARALADALAAGCSLRGALLDLELSLDGPARAELGRVRADLELGRSPRGALSDLGERLRSERIWALVRATLSQERSGGDLAELLRRHAAAAGERRRAEDDARSATAQARLTGGMVVALPVIVGVMIELFVPGFVGGMLSDPVATLVLLLSAGLQLAGFLLIRRLGRVAA